MTEDFKQSGLCPECGDNLDRVEDYSLVTAHFVMFGNSWKLDDRATEFDGLESVKYVCNSCQWSDKA